MRFLLHLRSFKGPFRTWMLVAGLVLAAGAGAQSQNGNPPVDPQKIVHDASYNELHAKSPGRSFRYRQHKVEPKGSSVKEIVETKDGDVARLIEKDGRPLPPEEEQAEIDRLNHLLAHPEVQEHRHKKEQEDSARGDEMVRMLPDAFLFTFDGMVEGPSGPCYRLKFKPNPAFTPPDREGEVYHGMVGELWVDQAQLRLAQDRCPPHLRRELRLGRIGQTLQGREHPGAKCGCRPASLGDHPHEAATTRQIAHDEKRRLLDHGRFQRLSGSQPQELGYQEAIHLLQQDSGPGSCEIEG